MVECFCGWCVFQVTSPPRVDYVRRGKIVPNHTFTHVLNFALRKVLGDHVDQKGSIVLPERYVWQTPVYTQRTHTPNHKSPPRKRLRFDFNNNGAIDPAKLQEIEAICRSTIEDALPIYTKEVPLQQAREINGLRAVFGEVYPDPVRVVSIGKSIDDLLANPAAEDNAKYSIEFCGGTHLKNTSDAAAFALLSEEAVAKGIRRVTAVTGEEARVAIAEGETLLTRVQNADGLDGSALDVEVLALKNIIDSAVVPAPVKVQLRAGLFCLWGDGGAVSVLQHPSHTHRAHQAGEKAARATKTPHGGNT